VILEEAQLQQDYETVHGQPIRSVMVAPLIYQDELIGTLNLSATEPESFTTAHQDVALQVADQLAIAIRQADLYQQVQRHAEELEQRVVDRTRELSTLYEVTAVASEMIDLQSMLARSLKQLLIALRCQVGIIYLTTGASGELRMFTQHGLTPEAMAQVEALLLDNQLIKRVFEGGKPVTVPDLTADSHLTEPSNLVDLETYAGVPIRAGGQGLGVLNVFGAFKQQFNVEDLALLASVGDQIGVAVENFRLRQQAEQAAVMEERERLARELHDSVTQSLYSLTLFTEGSLELVKNGQLELVEHNLTRIGETAQQALKEMRLLVYELRPLDLEKEGFVGALHQRLATVEKRAGVNARLVAEELVELSPHLEKELYRITQEALNNTLKHAEATFIAVYLRVVNEYVELEIVDNGKGFEPASDSNRGGLGLLSMQERIEMLGGSLDIRSARGKGTIIHVRVKID
jgi:signal transduction histidine kinase